jgi:hypothetical protein
MSASGRERTFCDDESLASVMIAFGCLLLIVLPLIGLAVGGYVAGGEGAAWAAGAGLAIAIAVCGVSAAAIIKAGRQR